MQNTAQKSYQGYANNISGVLMNRKASQEALPALEQSLQQLQSRKPDYVSDVWNEHYETILNCIVEHRARIDECNLEIIKRGFNPDDYA